MPSDASRAEDLIVTPSEARDLYSELCRFFDSLGMIVFSPQSAIGYNANRKRRQHRVN